MKNVMIRYGGSHRKCQEIERQLESGFMVRFLGNCPYKYKYRIAAIPADRLEDARKLGCTKNRNQWKRVVNDEDLFMEDEDVRDND